MLIIDKLSKSFAEKGSPVLNNLDFRLETGSFTALLGRNGSGKSTLLRLAYGVLRPDKGTVSFEGKGMEAVYDALLPGHPEMEWVDQKMQTLDYHSVRQNIYQKIRHWEDQEATDRIDYLMEFFDLHEYTDEKAARLSGGFQQRLALARAVATKPKLLLLDEPFSQQDPQARAEAFRLLKEINSEMGTTVLIVTHQVQEALIHCKEMAFLEDGHIIQRDEPKRFYHHPSTIQLGQFCGDLNLLDQSKFEQLFPDEKTFSPLPNGNYLLRPSAFFVSSKAFAGAIKAEVREEQAHLSFSIYRLQLSADILIRVASTESFEKGQVVFLQLKSA